MYAINKQRKRGGLELHGVYCTLIQYLAILLGLLIFTGHAEAQIVVITHPESRVETITRDELRDLWLGTSQFVNRTRLEVIDLAEEVELRDRFYLEVIGMNSNQIKAHWAKRVFMGQGFPPRRLGSWQEVLTWVREEPDRIGYVDSSEVDDTVRVIWSQEQELSEEQE